MLRRNRIIRCISILSALMLTVLHAPSVSAKSQKDCMRSASSTYPMQSAHEIASQAAYMMDAAMGEWNAILQYAAGKDPTAGKTVDEKGQNTKRNTATTLMDFARQLRPVRSLYFKLLPCPDMENVWELCAFCSPLFGDEQIVHTGLLHDYSTQTIYRADGTGILGIGYDFNFAFDTFYAADDPWQRNFGFCPLYDKLGLLIGDVYETIRVPFRYDDRDWMVQIWKGVYSGNMLGAEIGVYNKPTERKVEFYDCAADPDRVEMSFSVYYGNEKIVESENKISWWQTAFTYHKPVKPCDLTLNGLITFQNVLIAKAFARSLSEQNNDLHILRNGREVRFIW